MEALEKRVGKLGEYESAVPPVGVAAWVPAWWGDDVAAVAAHVDAWSERGARGVTDLSAGVGEVQVPAARPGTDPQAFGQWDGGLQSAKAVETPVAGVDVEYHDAGFGAGADAEVRVRPSLPPASEDGRVDGSIVEASCGSWMLPRG